MGLVAVLGVNNNYYLNFFGHVLTTITTHDNNDGLDFIVPNARLTKKTMIDWTLGLGPRPRSVHFVKFSNNT